MKPGKDSVVLPPILDLTGILANYRKGERALPTYAELALLASQLQALQLLPKEPYEIP